MNHITPEHVQPSLAHARALASLQPPPRADACAEEARELKFRDIAALLTSVCLTLRPSSPSHLAQTPALKKRELEFGGITDALVASLKQVLSDLCSAA